MSTQLDENANNCVHLQTTPPLPIHPVSWTEGWCRNAPTEATALAQARREALAMLFGYKTSTADVLRDTASRLREYADKLAHFIRRDKYSAQHRRRVPLTFMWCFPAETRPVEEKHAFRRNVQRSEVVVMQSAYMAFEYMCVMMTSAVLLARAGMQFHVSREEDRRTECLNEAVVILRTLRGMAPGKYKIEGRPVINEAQWARLRRQALPIQLQPGFREFFIAQLVHRKHLYYSLQVVSDEAASQAALRFTETTALAVFKAAREWLLKEPYLKTKQQETVQQIYDAALRAVVQFRTYGILQDAELAADSSLPGIARVLRDVCERGWWAFDGEDEADAYAKEELFNRSRAVQALLRSVPMDGTTEAAAMQWRQRLPAATVARGDNKRV